MIEGRDALLSGNRTLGIGKRDSSEVNLQLSVLQLSMYDAISLAKLEWSVHQAEKIHSMPFNPKDAYKSVRVLSGGYTSHHILSTIMPMRLPNS